MPSGYPQVRLGQSRVGRCSPEERDEEGNRTYRRRDRCPDHLGHRGAGLRPKLRALLHAGGFFRLSNDSGIEKRDSDPHRSPHPWIHWHDFRGISQTQSGQTGGQRA